MKIHRKHNRIKEPSVSYSPIEHVDIPKKVLTPLPTPPLRPPITELQNYNIKITCFWKTGMPTSIFFKMIKEKVMIILPFYHTFVEDMLRYFIKSFSFSTLCH